MKKAKQMGISLALLLLLSIGVKGNWMEAVEAKDIKAPTHAGITFTRVEDGGVTPPPDSTDKPPGGDGVTPPPGSTDKPPGSDGVTYPPGSTGKPPGKGGFLPQTGEMIQNNLPIIGILLIGIVLGFLLYKSKTKKERM